MAKPPHVKLINFGKDMTKGRITKFGPTGSCIQFRIICEVVVSEVVSNGKRLSIDLLVEIAHGDFRGCFTDIKLIDKLIRECQKTIKDTMFESEATVIGKEIIDGVRMTTIKLVVK